MIDLNKLSPPELRAAMTSGALEWGIRGSVLDHVRYMMPSQTKSRRRCPCCNKRSTHIGMANGVAMAMGCEARINKWVGNPLGA